MRLVKVLAVAALFIAVPAVAASAADYTPASNASITLNKTTFAVGDIVTANVVPGSATGQKLAGVTNWFVNSTHVQVAVTAANADGSASATFAMPNVGAGTHTVEASGTSQAGTPLDLTAAVTVTSGSALARTGATHVALFLRTGILLLLVGASLVLGVRRRRGIAHA